MANKVAKFKFGEKVKNSKNKTLTISGAYKIQQTIYYYVEESNTPYAEHELEKIKEVKS